MVSVALAEDIQFRTSCVSTSTGRQLSGKELQLMLLQQTSSSLCLVMKVVAVELLKCQSQFLSERLLKYES